MTTIALVLLALALLAAVRPAAARARLRALDHGTGGRTRRMWSPSKGRAGGAAAGGGLLFGGIAHLGFGEPVPVVPILAGMLAGLAAGSLLTSAAGTRRRSRQDAELVEWVGALAADLRAGRNPAEARADRDPPGQSPAVAAVWTVSERSGASAAAVLDRIEQDLRTGVRHRQEISAQLAGARSTAALLAVLPLLGIGLGVAMGARPLDVLFATGRGQLALLFGTGLDALGLLWTARIVAAAGGEG